MTTMARGAGGKHEAPAREAGASRESGLATSGSRVATFILAGGEGRRLLPLTHETPKPAVPFGPDGRIIDHVLESCLASGICDAAVLLQYRAEPLERYLAGRLAPRFAAAGGALALVRSGAGPVPHSPGTADVILEGLRVLPRDIDALLVLAADHVYRMDYRAFVAAHLAAGADLTIGAVEVPLAQATRFGVIEADAAGRVLRFVEKPRAPAPLPEDPTRALASMGIYVFRRGALEAARDALGEAPGLDFGRDVVPAIVLSGARVQVFRHREPRTGRAGPWFDVGTPEALLEASLACFPEGAAARDADVAPGALVRRSVLRAGARVCDGATVEEAFVLDGAVVERGAHVRRAVIAAGAHVRAGAVIEPDPRAPERVPIHVA